MTTFFVWYMTTCKEERKGKEGVRENGLRLQSFVYVWMMKKDIREKGETKCEQERLRSSD